MRLMALAISFVDVVFFGLAALTVGSALVVAMSRMDWANGLTVL